MAAGRRETKIIKVGERTLLVEVANSFFQRMVGLSFRKTINADGMLFCFPFKRRWPVWMLGMKFPIDLVWMNEEGIVETKKGLEKPKTFFEALRTHKPKTAIKYLIELPGKI